MVTWPSGKAKVCKTFIHQFKSGRHLHKTVMKKMSQPFSLLYRRKSAISPTSFQVAFCRDVQPFLGGWTLLLPRLPAKFWMMAGEGAIFLRKKQNKSCCFQNVFNFPAANFWTAPHLLDSMIYYLTSGVFCYAKRSTKQTIYAGVQENGCRNHEKRTSEYLCSNAGIWN